MKLKNLLLLGAMAFSAIIVSPTTASAQESQGQTSNAAAQPAITWVTMKAVQEAPANSIVYARGTIVSISEPRPNSRQPYTVYLTDETGSCRAVIFQDIYAQMQDTTFLTKGTSVDIYGELQDYRGIRQLHVRGYNHIRKSPGTNAANFGFGRQAAENAFFPLTIGAINMTTIGQPVRVKGVVSEIEEPSNERTPWRVFVEDTTGRIQVIYWQDVHQSLPEGERPVKGQPFECAGVVNEYRGLLQLRVDDASHARRNSIGMAIMAEKKSSTTAQSR